MTDKQIIDYIETKRDLFTTGSDQIWEYAEIGMKEYESSDYLVKLLENEGFAVEKGVADMPTAFVGSFGSGAPVIAMLGEYDALPGLSQKAGSCEQKENLPGGNGHGCGHNILGMGSLAASFAIKKYLEETGKSGTIRFYGCPGEENSAGKTYMARDGLFDDVDTALCWHPMDSNNVLGIGSQACMSAYFRFKGRSAHAAAAPHLGRSALDAVELMNVGANYLREHVPPDSRFHYAITDPGGKAPNVVQDSAEVYYYVRAHKTKGMFQVYERLCDVARGAALMTGTELEIVFQEGISDVIPNKVLGEVMHRRFAQLGPPLFDAKDHDLAGDFQATLSEEEIEGFLSQMAMLLGSEGAKALKGKTLSDVVSPFLFMDFHMPGSSDVGDVSYVVPTVQLTAACCALATPAHTWQFTAQMATPLAHRGMLHAAKVMSLTAMDIIENPEIAEKARAELLETTGGVYDCPMPKDLKPIR